MNIRNAIITIIGIVLVFLVIFTFGYNNLYPKLRYWVLATFSLYSLVLGVIISRKRNDDKE